MKFTTIKSISINVYNINIINKMISSQQIKSTTSKPVEYKDYLIINVLKWNNSKWKTLCPYYLKTDGNEECYNKGNVIFENFYQGMKVYDIVYQNEVYASKYHINKPKYLWWKFVPLNSDGDVIVKNNEINYENYLRWRDDLWKCPNPIRYPNKIGRRKNTQFSLLIDKNGNETRMDYITSRKEIYVKDYIRLIKNVSEYKILLDYLKEGKKLMICEVDVPAKNKKGEYGKCDENNISDLTLDKLNLLLNDTQEAFGHGLCLAYSLLKDLN